MTQIRAAGEVPTPEQKLADLFAAVLIGENPDGGNWASPATYLKASVGRPISSPATIKQVLQTPVDQYGVIIGPGF